MTKDHDSLGNPVNPVNRKSGAFSMFVSRHRLLWLLLFAVVFIGLDQLTKSWAQETLATRVIVSNTDFVDGEAQALPMFKYEGHRDINVVPGFLNFIYRENPAAAFSLTRSFPDWFRRPFLLTVSTLASIFFLIWYFRIKEHNALLLSSFCLIMAGAVGNLIDRATLGYVIDFVDVYAGFLGYPGAHWPTFNVADSCIVMGAVGVLIGTFKKSST